MGKMPMLRFHARADMTASANPAESRRAGIAKQWLWTLDPVGNWAGFKSSSATTQPWDLDQARLHNKTNEIEDTVNQTPNAISGTPDWVDPAYDLAGNMISGPQPRYETLDARALRFLRGGRIPGSRGQLCRSAAAGAGIAAEIVHLQSLRPGRARPGPRTGYPPSPRLRRAAPATDS